MLAVPAGREDHVAGLAPPDLAVEVVPGGPSRSESVAAALDAIPPGTDIVAVHDAARPLVTDELIDAVIARLAVRPDADAVIAAAPVVDTVKRARAARGAPDDDGWTVAGTESRELLWAAQTPQAFRVEPFRAALGTDRERLPGATDDAMLIEEAGGTVVIEPSPATNLKVTTGADLRLAELLLLDR